MIRIMARISSRTDSAVQLQDVLTELVGPTRGETGCISYEVYRNEDCPVEFVTIEQWADQASANAHMASPHVAAAIAKAGPLLDQAPLIHRFALVA